MKNRDLRQRPVKISRNDHITPTELEKIFSHYDNRIIELDNRRITQQNAIEAGATDSETIQNILTGLNNLINALNKSSLTEND